MLNQGWVSAGDLAAPNFSTGVMDESGLERGGRKMQPGMMPTETDRAAMGHDDPRCAAVLTELKTRLGAKPFALWCQDKIELDIRDDVLTISVGSPFLLNCMQKQFAPVLTAAAQAVLGPSASAVMTVDARLSLSPTAAATVRPAQPAETRHAGNCRG